MNKNQINDLILKDICFAYYENDNKKIILENFNCKIKKVNLQVLLVLRVQAKQAC